MNIPEGLRSQVRMYMNWAQQMIQDYGNTMSERETETRLVEPLLEILQWDPKGVDVRKGYPIKTEGANYEADYALMIDSKPRILVEVKKVSNSLSHENVIQLMRYAFYEKADIFILTNGNEWKIYEPYHLQDMVFQFELENMEDNLSCLWLLSKHSLGTGLLDQELDRRYAIEKVYGYIEEHREDWISDIERISKKFTKNGIGSILNIVIADKNVVLDKLSPKPLPIIDLPPPDVELASIADDHTGKSISSFWFNRLLHEVHSWRELLVTLSSVINTMHGDEFGKALEVKGQKRLYFSHNENELKAPKRIPDTDIFVETNLSARNTTQVCRQLIAVFGYSDDDLKVGVHAGKAGNGESDKYTLDGKFSGAYSDLRAIYDSLEIKIRDFGDDVKINVRKYYIGFMRNNTFAVVRLIRDGIYLGLSLDPSVEHDRLREVDRWRGWSWVNKVILVSKIEEVDTQLIEWLKQSYDRS